MRTSMTETNLLEEKPSTKSGQPHIARCLGRLDTSEKSLDQQANPGNVLKPSTEEDFRVLVEVGRRCSP